ncbi:hypothetical protein A3I57_04075 [Candidatus Beckwithbacteria bacterium RIFCSPLOWO2_02_FULL_47_23]|uniref:HTH merR-type domain-containing protein n=1 Tax=Candidatus Beckwithbacteria bacterium RIFCSPLOWO2_02_FULL_47_23 TaxID=1797463 RepID=A0A1F5DUA8_9BACT|nr:MAG: hypothetical protein A3I57_04075 [Candidatus Beckwithbacteria bacterium RIFCSPLOWO2_02_FULL_47_23]
MKNLISAGELAKLAVTTKRTILFYDERGVLKPRQVNEKKYRFYEPSQILDYQMILLLSTLGVSLDQIKTYLKNRGKLAQLFSAKKALIQKQINLLQFNLNNLEKFLANLNTNKTLVDPQVKVLKPFGVYYVDRIGAYSQIDHFCRELLAMFINGQKLTTLAIFEEQGYRPKKSRIKIGVMAQKNLVIKSEYRDQVKFLKFNPGKVLTYIHHGSGSLLSLFWKELEKYCRLNKIKIRKDVPDFEIYRSINSDITKQFFEIYLPIK